MLIQDVPERPAPDQLRRLRAHLPYTLNLLRRCQVAAGAFDAVHGGPDGHKASVGGGTSPFARVMFAYDVEEGRTADDPSTLTPDTPFAAVYVDLSKAPETAAWFYASDQDDSAFLYPADNDAPETWQVDRGAALVAGWAPARRARARRLVLVLLRRIRSLAKELAPTLESRPLPPGLEGKAVEGLFSSQVKGNLHDGLRYLLQHPEEGVHPKDGGAAVAARLTYFDAYDKWLFRAADVPVLSQAGDTTLTVPAADGGSPTTLAWDRVRAGDLPLVVSRTSIPRGYATLLLTLSLALRDPASGVLQAWAFLGVDGSLWTLHCEPAHRGRGVAKTLAARLLRQYCGVFDAVEADVAKVEEDMVNGTGTGGPPADKDSFGDGWLAADVSARNRQSQGVCRRLGGRRAWATSWIAVAYDSLGEDDDE